MFARDPDAILDLRELNVDGLTDKYKADHADACEVLTGWEVSGTLREFAPAQPLRVWFDYPLHVVDNHNYLAIASYSDSGSSGRGTGKDQKQQTDWYQIVEDLLGLTSDTAVNIEAVGIKEGNAKSKFRAGTDYELATVNGDKVLHRRTDDEIVYFGEKYTRKRFGNISKWEPVAG